MHNGFGMCNYADSNPSAREGGSWRSKTFANKELQDIQLAEQQRRAAQKRLEARLAAARAQALRREEWAAQGVLEAELNAKPGYARRFLQWALS